MLGPLSNSFERQKALGITLQARIWWYKSRLGIDIDRAAYEGYCTSGTAAASAVDSSLLVRIGDIQQRMGLAPTSDESSSSSLPAWMVEAPQKVDLNKKADDGARSGGGPDRGSGSGNGDAPYPAHFQAIIDAVTTGKPVPGVREIPNTVVRQAVRFPPVAGPCAALILSSHT